MHSRGLRISNLIRHLLPHRRWLQFALGCKEPGNPQTGGSQSKRQARATGPQLRQLGNNQISQNFSVKTSLEGSESLDVGGSSVTELRCGRQ